MTFQALLFCPDERTARLATQVLNELEFGVEACNEPFAAVKKLMGKHFDAVVVDCDNEQNASLLFKSARNSAANQGALAVAIVEGQAGVANAFRVGANLVLTKPINVEQAKSTLRVARGLLRKGSDPKATTAPASAPATTPVSKPPAPPAKTLATPPSLVPKPTLPPAQKPKPAPSATATAKPGIDAEDLFETDEEDASTMQATGDSLFESGEREAPAPSQENPWQPVSRPTATPSPSLQRALEDAGRRSSVTPQAAKAAQSAVPPQKTQPTTTPMRAQGGAASAPAPALEATRTTPALFAGQSAPADQHPPAETDEPLFPIAEPPEPLSAPSFAALDLQEGEEASGGGAKKGIIVAVAVIALAAAAYFGYTKFAGSRRPQPTAPVASQPQAPAPAAEPAAGQEMDITVGGHAASAPATQDLIIERTPVHTPPPSRSNAAASSANAAAKASRDDEEEVMVSHPEAPKLVVKSDLGATKPKEEPAPAEAAAPDVSVGEDSGALSSIVKSAPVAVPRVAPPQGVVKVSQGVTQGLILKRVQPVYPQQALQMRVHGSVLLQAEISKTGNITNVKVLSGDAILASAAVRAVSQWKYKPYYLNGEPVDIQTQITVNFKLPSE
jgi:protein TonB